MALNKIPDSMLPKFTCTKCKHFVTMEPIAVEEDGQISCGKCTDWSIPRVRCNLLESLATLYAFPCKFKHAGCPEYMPFNQTHEHERECEFHTLPCPYGVLKETCTWNGLATGMMRHYKRQHPQFSADYPNFKITLEDEYEKYFMIEVDHIPLLLQIKLSLSEGKLWFNTVYLGDTANSNVVWYRINISCQEISKQVITLQSQAALSTDDIKMEVDKCVEITKKALLDVLPDATYIHCSWNIFVYTELEDIIKIDIEKEQQENEHVHLVEPKSRNTNCPNCNILMIPPIFRCVSENHVTCCDCKGYYNECKCCQKNDQLFKRAEDLERIAQLKFYKCRWVGCNETFTFQKIRMHEHNCTHKIFKCPKCNVWSGDADDLSVHFKVTHPKLRLSEYNPLLFTSVRFIPGYILTYNELFLLEVDANFRRGFTICHVTYLGPPSHFYDWEVILTTRSGHPLPKHKTEVNRITFRSQPSALVRYKLNIRRADTIKTDDN